MRKRDRVGLVRRMCGASEWGLSDHRPKCLRVSVCTRKWRAVATSEETRVPRVMHERMSEDRVREVYERKTCEKMESVEWEGVIDEWGKLAEVMVAAASDVCGERRSRASNPWVVGRERELEALHYVVNEAVERRNECAVRLRNRRRLRARVNDMVLRGMERELEEAKECVKGGRRELKRSLKRWEKEWWDRLIEECRDACEEGRMGRMYKVLNDLGGRGMRAREGTNVGVNDFKEHFQGVSFDSMRWIRE